MTAMPQMVALFNGVGGGAVALIAFAEFHNLAPLEGDLAGEESVAILLSALIGSISFSGSMIAFAKLQELLSGRPIVYPGQQFVNGAVLLAARFGGAIVAGAERDLLVVLDRGGADVRRPLRPPDRRRRHAGRDLAPERLHRPGGVRGRLPPPQQRPHRGGALVGASGTLLTLLMGKAMNRSIGNVLFGAFGAVQAGTAAGAAEDGLTVRSTTRGPRDHARLRP